MKKSTRFPNTASGAPIKTFWFDLGNVILFFDFMPAYRKLSRYTDSSPEEIAEYFKVRTALEYDLDEGKVHALALFRRIKKDLRLDGITYDRFKEIWNDIFTENRPVIRLLERLKKEGYRLVLISNTNRLHYEYILKNHAVLHLFDRLILSFKVKTRKPKRSIYETALSVSRARPREIFYTDDREEMIAAAAENHGVHAHLFRDAESLERELRRLKVI